MDFQFHAAKGYCKKICLNRICSALRLFLLIYFTPFIHPFSHLLFKPNLLSTWKSDSEYAQLKLLNTRWNCLRSIGYEFVGDQENYSLSVFQIAFLQLAFSSPVESEKLVVLNNVMTCVLKYSSHRFELLLN